MIPASHLACLPCGPVCKEGSSETAPAEVSDAHGQWSADSARGVEDGGQAQGQGAWGGHCTSSSCLRFSTSGPLPVLFPLPGMPFPRGKLLLMLQSPDSQLHFLSDGHFFSEVLAIFCHSREAGIGAISQMREETEAQRGDLSCPRSHSRESRSGTWGYAGSVTDRLPGLRA